MLSIFSTCLADQHLYFSPLMGKIADIVNRNLEDIQDLRYIYLGLVGMPGCRALGTDRDVSVITITASFVRSSSSSTQQRRQELLGPVEISEGSKIYRVCLPCPETSVTFPRVAVENVELPGQSQRTVSPDARKKVKSTKQFMA